MMQILFLGFLFVVGAAMGSFLCCQVRRAAISGFPPRKGDKRRLPSRSVCLHCHRQLKWHDNIPVISWLWLRGRCRFCHKKIGAAEFIAEILVAVAFLMLGASFLNSEGLLNFNAPAYFENISGINWGIFVTELLLTLSLAFLAIYDGLYGELPNLCLTISLIFAIILVALRIGNSLPVLDALIAGASFGGIYLILYLVSKGRWVGDGDWILAGIIGLALGRPFLSLVALFLANFLAVIVMFPAMKSAAKTHGEKSHLIYFGPFLVVAYVITASLAPEIMSLILV